MECDNLEHPGTVNRVHLEMGPDGVGGDNAGEISVINILLPLLMMKLGLHLEKEDEEEEEEGGEEEDS